MVRHYKPINVFTGGFTHASVTKKRSDGSTYLSPTKSLTIMDEAWLMQTLIQDITGRLSVPRIRASGAA